MPQNFKNLIFIFITVLLLPSLTSAQEKAYDVSFTEKECTAISSATGQNLKYYPPGCDLRDNNNADVEYIDKIEDISILRSGLDTERNTLLRFSDPTTAKTHMDEVVALLLETDYVSTDDKYKALPYIKETVMIGDGGILLIGETSSHVNRIGVIKDSNLRDYENGWISEFRTHLIAQKGSCVIAIAGQTSLNSKQDEFHSIRYDSSNTHKNVTNVTGYVVNEHPGFDHGKAKLLEWAKGEAIKLEKAIGPYCSGSNATAKAPAPPVNKSNYTQALVIEPPKKSDFQKISKSDFKLVYPVGTSSATLKLATESANLTGTTFIGKVGGEGELILQLPDGKEVKLEDDKSAYEGEKPYARWHDISGRNNYIAPKRSVYIEEVDCHILLEQEGQKAEALKRSEGIRYASDWSVDDTIIIKPTGDCSYMSEGEPVRVLAIKGQVTFKTLGNISVSANNADFGIGYNAKPSISIIEIYNGSIIVTNNAGNSKTISTTYGEEIKQIELDKDGVMNEKIAIPLSQWEAFLASRQEKKEEPKGNTLPIAGAVAVLVLGGIVFFLYRTGKLLPLYKVYSQKIVQMLQKIRKEKKID
ncbi:hypothetical protein HY383_03150 [Candidatus Daviesbacteria bacterium]|nr:hypothetical protein [Candidatus Daviesbacteria bacterium]